MLGWLVDGYGNIEEVDVPLCGGFYLPDDRLISLISLIDKFTVKGGVCMYDRKTLELIEEFCNEQIELYQSTNIDIPFDQLDEGDQLFVMYRQGNVAALRLVRNKVARLVNQCLKDNA